MLGKIISVSDSGFKLPSLYNTSRLNGYDGYEIILNNGDKILIGIDDQSNCCENWGYVASEDSFDEYIGAEVLSVDVVDGALNVKTKVELYEGGCMFVNVNTSKGLLQFVVYNEHNGYYSHDAVLVVAGNISHRENL